MDALVLTADQILSIKYPGRLFDQNSFKEQHQKLCRLWHPDRNYDPNASKVMAHINVLYSQAELGQWGNVFNFKDIDSSKEYTFKYRKVLLVDIGEMYIGEQMVLFNVKKGDADLVERGFNAIRAVRYPSRMLEENFKRFVPRDVHLYKTETGMVLTMYKGPHQICLKDIVDSGFVFQPGHLSWILTGLYNFILFMQQAQNKMFGGLSLDSIFINTKMRGIHILGGWWYSANLGQSIDALPEWLFQRLPKATIQQKKSVGSIDLLALRVLSINLLGDDTMVGSKLLISHPKSKNLVQFLRSSPSETTIKDYQRWVLIEKELSKLDIALTFNDVYNEE